MGSGTRIDGHGRATAVDYRAAWGGLWPARPRFLDLFQPGEAPTAADSQMFTFFTFFRQFERLHELSCF